MGQLRSDKTRLHGQYEQKDWRGDRTHDRLESGLRRIETCIRKSGRLRLSMVKNLLTFGMSVNVYKPGWPLMMIAVKCLASLCVFPVSNWRRIKGFPCLCICAWSQI